MPTSGAIVKTSRRRVVAYFGAAALGLLGAACGQAAPTATKPAAAPTAASAAPTTASAAPTTAAAAPTSASAAQPTAAATTAAQPAAKPAAQGAASGAAIVPLYKISTGSKPFLDEAGATFSKQHPELKLEPVYVNGDEYDPKADLLIAAGTPPSLIYPANTRSYRYYASRDLILNLDPLVQRDNYGLDDFAARQLAGCKWKGTLAAMPKTHSPWLLFYHKGAFDNAKLAYPPLDWKDPEWTWDRFLEYAKALTITQNGKIQQYGAGTDFGGWPAGWANGGDFFNHDWTESGWITKYTAPDEPATVDAVQFWADLPGKHHYAPTKAETQSTQAAAPNLFMTGRIAMYLEYTGFLNQYAKITDFEWGIAAWPHASGSQYPMHHGAWMDQWAIFKAAKNLEGSWEFLKYIASPEGQTITDVKRGSPSSRKSLGQAWVNFWREQIPKLDPKQINVAVEAMTLDSLTPDNWSVNFSPLDGKVLAPALDKVALGQQSAADALKAIKPQMDAAVADTHKTMGYTG